ncbi:hypothetical protein TEA_006839 [Camellia sinensis var. sinensis]|uniref:Pentatricopeptide repeat-containing protein n=1 Tax=Camellia sinensis var. sinensis TaxID=542762 RepID=A0A4S4ELF2_CAMSN|nr:hypothetical protein TEA_006839 [Camellia sinensis var. sinensis]
MYSRARDMDSAKKVFDEMPMRECLRASSTGFNSFLSMFRDVRDQGGQVNPDLASTGTPKIVPYKYRVFTGCGYANRYGGMRTGYGKRVSATFGSFGYAMGILEPHPGAIDSSPSKSHLEMGMLVLVNNTL